jgi:hypothetical protein
MVIASRCAPAKYFWVVGVHPVYALVALGAVVVLGVATVWLNAGELDTGLGMILFAQMFLASSGFLVRARQGHYDALLSRGRQRKSILLAHWIVSIAPGLAAWLIVALAGALVGSPSALSAIAGARGAGLFIVSAASWSLGFALPRGAAGMLWMSLLMVLVMQRAELLAASTGASPGAMAAMGSIVRQAVTVIVCPFLLVGNHPVLAPAVVLTALLLSALPLFYLWSRAELFDIYLEGRT